MTVADPEEELLLVDDNVTLRHELASSLADSEILGRRRIHEASSGREALEIDAERRTTVAVVDLVMPEMDGIEVAQQLQQRNPDLEIIFLTAHDNPQFREQAAAAQLRIAKWIDKDSNTQQKIIDTLQEVLGRKAIERQVVAVIKRRLARAAKQLALGEEAAFLMERIVDPQSIVVPIGVTTPVQKKDAHRIRPRPESYTDFQQLLHMLSMHMDELLEGYRDPAARQCSWSAIRELVTLDLWDATELYTDNRYIQEIVLLLEQAVKRIDSPLLTLSHIRGVYLCVERLSSDKITQSDVSDCRRHWDATGVEVLPTFADIARDFEEAYSDETDENKDTDRDNDPSSSTR